MLRFYLNKICFVFLVTLLPKCFQCRSYNETRPLSPLPNHRSTTFECTVRPYCKLIEFTFNANWTLTTTTVLFKLYILVQKYKMPHVELRERTGYGRKNTTVAKRTIFNLEYSYYECNAIGQFRKTLARSDCGRYNYRSGELAT